MKRILALCGGGAAGYASAKYLQAMEAACGKPLAEIFDLIAGVSTGSIIAACAGAGYSMNEVSELYKQNLPAIFRRSKWKWWRGLICGSKYDNAPLYSFLKEKLPLPFSSLDCTRVMIHATMVDPKVAPKHWKSYATSQPCAADAVMASCCAPTYFAPHQIGDMVFVDGGLTANNPASMALAEGLSFGWDRDEIRILTVQPMSYYRRVPDGEKRRSALQWAPVLPPVFVGTDQRSVDYECGQLLDQRYRNINLMVNTAMDDAGDKALGDMAIDAGLSWADSQDMVKVLLRL